jgi:hypothetical protein
LTYYVQAARTCECDLEQRELRQSRPARRKESIRLAQFFDPSAVSLVLALAINAYRGITDKKLDSSQFLDGSLIRALNAK